ncbi:D-alanine--D-alanine ligase [Patescibacteria group bacterium]|nr:D-alanine--D-alanine ligase [Patescibacteria group bacterium]MBU1613263.1 D-alanine--D-alanine ligase [Patescibacteria group bacterium]
MKKKMKIGVLVGGPSSERAVSLITGKAIFDNLNRKKYLPSLIEMGKDSSFNLIIKKGKKKLDFLNKDRKRFDLIFIALHGTPGEDGTVQGMLEMLGIPYTGSETMSSAISMNKVFSAQIYHANDLPSPVFVNFKKNGWKEYKDKILQDVSEKVGYPAVIKPVDQGSAVGVSIVRNEEELVKFVDKTIKKFTWLMIQEFINGQEATCGIIEKESQILPFPPTRIVANLGEFYDYKSKYSKGGSTHICPADFSEEINTKIQNLAISAHRVLGCRGMSRTDIFVSNKKDAQGAKKLYIIETNTIPGMTPTSLFPEAAGKIGIDFGEMLDLIIEASLYDKP